MRLSPTYCFKEIIDMLSALDTAGICILHALIENEKARYPAIELRFILKLMIIHFNIASRKEHVALLAALFEKMSMLKTNLGGPSFCEPL